MDKATGFDLVFPIGEELPHDTFILLHQDGNSQSVATFTEVFVDNIIRHMIDFLRGCGHYDDVIYNCMQEIADEHFKSQEKKLNSLTPDLEDLDYRAVLG